MSAAVRWGILGGASKIAREAVAPAIEASERNVLVAQASRDAAGTDAPYAELLRRPDIDAVYVPLPNGLHRPWVEAAVEAGKHVLCEKPLGMDEDEAAAMFDAADHAGRTLLEAYMTPFHPGTKRVEHLIADGTVGDLRFLRATFTFPLVRQRPTDHRLDDELGGGASLDVGIYCVAPMLHAAVRQPSEVMATATWHGVRTDRSLAGFLDFGDGLSGAFEVSFEAPGRQYLEVVGTDGRIRYEHAFNPMLDPTVIELSHVDGRLDTIAIDGASAYLGMVDHFADVLDGASPRYGRDQTVAVARTLHRARTAAGMPPT